MLCAVSVDHMVDHMQMNDVDPTRAGFSIWSVSALSLVALVEEGLEFCAISLRLRQWFAHGKLGF